MNKYNGKIINYGLGTTTGTVDFIKPLVIQASNDKVSDANSEYEKYTLAVQNIKDFLWEQISSTNDKRYADALMLVEDQTFTNDIKKLIKKNKENAVTAIYLVSNKFKTMFTEIDDEQSKVKIDLVKYIEYLLFKQFQVTEKNNEIKEDSIYLVNNLSLYTTAVLSDLNPKGVIVKEDITNAISFNNSFVNPVVISLIDNNETFNALMYGEKITIDANDQIIIAGYEKVADDLYVESEEKQCCSNEEKAEEFNNSQVFLSTYVNDVTKVQHEGKKLIINTNKLFLEKEPTIEEQVEAYKNVLVQNGDEDVAFVLFNVDSLNKPNWIDYGNYVSDLLVKGIRLSYLNQDLFVNQIKALSIASKYNSKGITILLPLVSTNEELIVLKQEILDIRNQLVNEGVSVGHVKTSVVLETPSLGYDLSIVLENVDSLVLDIDELTQYLMAIEKNNQLFKHLYQPLNPVVLRFIKKIIKQVEKAGKVLSIQGVSVNEPEVFITLLGLGAKNIVVSKHFEQDALQLIEKYNNENTFNKVNEVLKYKTSRDVVEAIELYIEK